jgi:fumarylacetoacetase
MNHTHDPNARSWVTSANDPKTDFPIQNLPFGVFRRRGKAGSGSIGVAIGTEILDLNAVHQRLPFDGTIMEASRVFASSTLNELMALGPPQWSALRRRLFDLLRIEHPNAEEHRRDLEPALVPMRDAEMLLPAQIGDYTDFYASVHHATNVGSMLRPENPLMANYKHLPVAYHGRASSVVVDGTHVKHPLGQSKDDHATEPSFGPSRMLDYEAEIGFLIGTGNPLGEPVGIDDAEAHIFGLCLLNDWSARDIQKWEYQPLGPFLAKNFATTISPWIVTVEALEPYRVPMPPRNSSDPELRPYLKSASNTQRGGIDLTIEVYLMTDRMRREGIEAQLLSRGSFKDMYWSISQMVAHHTVNGCNLRTGDLIGSGTISGSTKESRGCLLELTWRGRDPIRLPTGETRTFLEDGDEVTLRGFCFRNGYARIGLGECRGLVLPGKTYR